MIFKVLKSLRQYWKATLLTLLFIIGEVILEVLIPFITADMVNNIKAGADLSNILKTGGTMVAAAIFSLLCGTLAGNFAAKASAGFAGNLRSDMFKKVQKFSFGNIDRFSTSSLVSSVAREAASACSGASTIKVAPNKVSGRVV